MDTEDLERRLIAIQNLPVRAKPAWYDSLENFLETVVSIHTKFVGRELEVFAKKLKKKELRPSDLRKFSELIQVGKKAKKLKKKRAKKLASAIKRMEKEDRANAPSSSPFFGEGKPSKKGGIEIPKLEVENGS